VNGARKEFRKKVQVMGLSARASRRPDLRSAAREKTARRSGPAVKAAATEALDAANGSNGECEARGTIRQFVEVPSEWPVRDGARKIAGWEPFDFAQDKLALQKLSMRHSSSNGECEARGTWKGARLEDESAATNAGDDGSERVARRNLSLTV
jgi:hypothetical protein